MAGTYARPSSDVCGLPPLVKRTYVQYDHLRGKQRVAIFGCLCEYLAICNITWAGLNAVNQDAR